MPSSTTQIRIKATDLASKPIKGIAGSIGNLGRSISRLRYAALGIGTVLGGFGLAKEFIEANRQLENMTARLGSLLNSAKAGEQAVAWVREFAEANPVRSVQEYTDSFEQLVAAGIDPTTGALKSLTAGAVKFGLSAGDVNGVTRALKQMLAVSNLQKQELNQLSERIPGIQAKMAAALGMTTEKFIKQTTQMKISSKDAANAVLQILGENADDVIKKFSNTWDAGIENLKSSWFTLLTEIGKTGIFDDFKNALNSVTFVMKNNLEEIKGTVKATWDFMGSAMKSFFNVDFFSGTTGQVFESITTGFSNVLAGLITFARGGMFTISNLGKLIVRLIEYIGDGITRARLALHGVFTESGLQAELEALQSRLDDMLKTKEKIEGGAKSRSYPSLKALKGGIEEVQNEMMELQKLSNELKKDSIVEFKFVDDFSSLQQSLTQIDGALDTFKTKMKVIGQQIDAKPIVPLDTSDSKASIDAYDAAMKGIVGSTETGTTEVKVKWKETLKEIRQKYEDTYKGIDNISSTFAKTLNNSLNRTFDDFFDDLLNGKIPSLRESFDRLTKDIIKMLLRIQTEKAALKVTESFTEAFAGGLGGILGGAGGGSVGGTGGLGSVGVTPTAPSMKPTFGTSGGGGMRQKVEIVNNSGNAMEVQSTRVKGDASGQVMQIVMDSVQRNKGGSRDSLKALLGR